jgi:hypothetical protein
MRNEELHNLYSSTNTSIGLSDQGIWGRRGLKHKWRDQNASTSFVAKPEIKRPFRRNARTQQHNIKKDLVEIRCGLNLFSSG